MSNEPAAGKATGAPVPSDQALADLVAGAAVLGVVLDGARQELFTRYRAEMLAWNAHTNLTAITDPAAVLTRHFLDSLTLALALTPQQRAAPMRLVDVGAGAGLPGLALAIAYPHWRVTLLDSVGKKTAFLGHACHALGLDERVTVLTGRAEDIAHDPAHRARYDIATARAVAGLATLAEYLLPFCRVSGAMVALKKGDLTAEVAAAAAAMAILGGGPLSTLPVPALADLGGDRALLVARKAHATPAAYPRRAGLPAKEPLGAAPPPTKRLRAAPGQ